MPILFVYGTLKRGDCRHRFLAGSRFLGLAVTSPGYRLFNLGDYPALVEDPSGGQIEGELYEVSGHGLRVLDEVEAVADELYVRRSIQLASPTTQPTAEAYFYLGSVTGKREILRRWIVPRPSM
jgi:gamma-glutamylaminecyclotransferase